MQTRRDMLACSATVAGLLAAAGFLPMPALAAWPQAAFEARNLADAVKALGGSTPVLSQDVSLGGPDIAEDGAVVPVSCAVALPGAKRLLLLVEKNPNTLAAVFELSDALEPSLNTRIKMNQSSRVFAVAMMGDGRVLYAAREIQVTLGGCGG